MSTPREPEFTPTLRDYIVLALFISIISIGWLYFFLFVHFTPAQAPLPLH